MFTTPVGTFVAVCGSIQWQISISLKVIREDLLLALTAFEIFTSTNCELENIGQDHDVQHLQWYNSMANTYLAINVDSNVCIFQHLLVKIPLEKFELENVGQGHGVQFSHG